jgi:DNA-binding transcriptional ArsR family regulator
VVCASVSYRRLTAAPNSTLPMYLDSYVTVLVRLCVESVLRAVADESRRTLLETLARGPATAGELAALLPIARPGVSRHLRVLREAGLVEAHQEAQRRVYNLRPAPLAEVDQWLDRYRSLWEQRLDALHTEVARGRRERRSAT